MGIRLSHSAPFHPQTKGKAERFHRTLKLEVLHEKQYKSCADIQKTFDTWQHTYNYESPNDALGGKTPSSRYTASSLAFPDKLCEAEYDLGDIVRKVDCLGIFKFKGNRYRAGVGFAGEYITIKETQKTESLVSSLWIFIKKFNLKKETKLCYNL